MVDLGVALRVQRGEREVFELLLQLLHAEAVRERGVDVERLGGDAGLLVGRPGGDRAHVVQPVGELDDEHAQVLGHRHEHLAHRGGLLGLLGVELQAVELGDAVHDLGDVVAEGPPHVVDRQLGVLHRVVQERGGDGHLVETEVGHDAGDGERVVDVLLARFAPLLGVRLVGDLVGAGDHRGGGFRVAAAERLHHRGEVDHRRGRGPPPGKHAVNRAHGRLLST